MRSLIPLALLLAALPARAGEDVLAAPAVLRVPFTTSGPYIEDDANTVMHCRGEDYTGGTLTCQTGGAWTTQGAISAVTTSALYPQGFSGTARKGMGPYSNANYFQLGTGADVLDFAGDFSVCVVFSTPSLATSDALVGASVATPLGWILFVLTSGNAFFSFNNGGGGQQASGVVVGGPNIVCAGRSGGNALLRVNNGSTATGAQAFSGAATATPSFIGIRNGPQNAFSGTIYELWASSTTPTDALFTKIHNRFLGHVGSFGEPLTVTRATTATYTVGGTVYTAPAGVARVESAGLLVEPARTNLVIRSREGENAAWTLTTDTVTANDATGVDGTTAADKHVQTASTGEAESTAFTTVASTTYTCSAYLKGIGPSETVNLWFRDVTNGTYTCSQKTLTGTLDRYTVSGATGVGGVSGSCGVGLVARGACAEVAAGLTFWADAWQGEAGAYATSAVFTTSAAVARNADVVSFDPAPYLKIASSDYSFSADATLLAKSGVQMLLGSTVDYQPYLRLFGGGCGCPEFISDSQGVGAATSAAGNQLVQQHYAARKLGTATYVSTNGTWGAVYTSGTQGAEGTMYIGYQGGGIGGSLGGWLKNVCFARTAAGCY